MILKMSVQYFVCDFEFYFYWGLYIITKLFSKIRVHYFPQFFFILEVPTTVQY